MKAAATRKCHFEEGSPPARDVATHAQLATWHCRWGSQQSKGRPLYASSRGPATLLATPDLLTWVQSDCIWLSHQPSPPRTPCAPACRPCQSCPIPTCSVGTLGWRRSWARSDRIDPGTAHTGGCVSFKFICVRGAAACGKAWLPGQPGRTACFHTQPAPSTLHCTLCIPLCGKRALCCCSRF